MQNLASCTYDAGYGVPSIRVQAAWGRPRRLLRVLAVVGWLAIHVGCTLAAGQEVPKTQRADEIEQAPPTAPRAEDAMYWLDRIEEQAAQVKTLHANIVYDRVQQLVGDRQRRFGTLVYETGPPARFAVHFDRLLLDQRLDHQDRWYIFDGVWLIERLDTEKQFFKRQVNPRPEGDPALAPPNSLSNGAGPFPLPMAHQKDQILSRFHVDLGENSVDDPEDSIHLHYVPKPNASIRFTQMDIWYDRQTLQPIRARTVDDSQNESIVRFTDIRLNELVDAGIFDISEPTQPGWQVEVTGLK